MTKAKSLSVKLAEHAIRTFAHSPDAGTPFEAVLDPAYWTHVASNHMVRDMIWVIPPENTYAALLMVRSVQKLALIVSVVQHTAFDQQVSEPDSGYSLKFRGRAGWSVMRGSEVAAEGYSTKEEAEVERTRLLTQLKAA